MGGGGAPRRRHRIRVRPSASPNVIPSRPRRFGGHGGTGLGAPTSRQVPQGHGCVRLVLARSGPAVQGNPAGVARHLRGTGQAEPAVCAGAGGAGARLRARHHLRRDAAGRGLAQGRGGRPPGPGSRQHLRLRLSRSGVDGDVLALGSPARGSTHRPRSRARAWRSRGPRDPGDLVPLAWRDGQRRGRGPNVLRPRPPGPPVALTARPAARARPAVPRGRSHLPSNDPGRPAGVAPLLGPVRPLPDDGTHGGRHRYVASRR